MEARISRFCLFVWNGFQMRRVFVLLCGALLVAGGSFAEKPKGKQTASDAKPPADAAAHAAGAPIDAKTYIIGAEDQLFVRVWDSQQVTSPVTVRPDGKISLLLVGEIQAAGMTPEQLAAKVAEALTKYMQHPDVSVSVTAINSKKYFISVEVSRTGSFPLLIPTTVSEALANAGGFKDFAKTKDIVIIRGSQRFHFNYKDVVIHGKHPEQNILLEPGDQIIVP